MQNQNSSIEIDPESKLFCALAAFKVISKISFKMLEFAENPEMINLKKL